MDLKELGTWLFQPGVRDIFRLETLSGYISTGDQPHYDRWRQGLPVEIDDGPGSWLGRIRRDSEEGITRRRVHVMSEPLAEHNLFECGEQYTRNSAAGEQIRVMTATQQERAGLCDFWMLDGEQVAVMNYDSEGRFLDACEPTYPKSWVNLAWALWRASEDFGPWWSARPHYHGQRQVA